MDTATRQLIEYARYHRDPRNIATHFVGIPLIAFGIAVTTIIGVMFLFQPDVMIFLVVLIIVIVQIIQFAGERISKAVDHR